MHWQHNERHHHLCERWHRRHSAFEHWNLWPVSNGFVDSPRSVSDNCILGHGRMNLAAADALSMVVRKRSDNFVAFVWYECHRNHQLIRRQLNRWHSQGPISQWDAVLCDWNELFNENERQKKKVQLVILLLNAHGSGQNAATLTPDIVELVRNRFYRASHKSVSYQMEPEQMCTAVDHRDRSIVVMRRPIDVLTSWRVEMLERKMPDN